MASVGFEVEDGQPCTSDGKKCKLPTTLPDNGGAVNHASVPKKLRSAMKKRVQKSVTPNSTISRKQHHVSNGFVVLRKDGGKRSKSNKKQGNITKDEEEVAETLYALAGMFSDAGRAEQPETKASATLEAGSSVNPVEEESRTIASQFTIDATRISSSLVDSVSNVGKAVNFQSLGESEQPELLSNKCVAVSNTSGDQPENLDPRPRVSNLDFIPSGAQAMAMEQHASVPSQIESKKTRKRCPGHVYISSLIKDLQVVSEGKERLLEKPAQTEAHAGQRSHAIMHNQMPETSGRNGCGSSNGTAHFAVENESAKIHGDVPSHKTALQDRQLAAETSAPCSATHQEFDFISLGAGASSLNLREGINRTRDEAPNQFHATYVNSQSNAARLFSPSQNGYSAAFHGQYSSLATGQIQLPPQYPGATVNSSFSAQFQLDSQHQQQKWAAELPIRYNTGGVSALQFPDWKNGGMEPHSMLNYTHPLLPHLQSALSSKYHQQFTHSQQQQQQQLMALNSTPLHLSNVKRNHNHILPLGFERNGSAVAFYQGSIPQHLQLPCNPHLSK